ncbi:alpha-(1-_3)-arabinofuranosyltransferase family protein [Staphylococcus chromogenes]|nr:alpha-(1->3)-arabinofuranosyltransferase family protein [Staphylococcus chromogenes]
MGWVLLGLLSFIQSPGRTVADTKHDLTANPAGFLGNALHAWTDVFPLGQLQNQAYGYLFPQGLFFLITEPLPDWIAQRLWWWLVIGVGFSGFLTLARRITGTANPHQFSLVLGAFLYALSPHTLSTLGAISSETWPMMLTPWVIAPLLAPAQEKNSSDAKQVAGSILAVAAMGAVNAVATAAACLPAAIVLICLRRWRTLSLWLLGCAAVSLWWIGPLLVLGKYSPPFTDFIESAFVTTRWLSLPEILRGTTSWAPFADAERIAGTALATNPYFVLATTVVGALGLVGLCVASQSALRGRRIWLAMLFVGIAVLGATHGPLGGEVLALFDGPLAALRNVHKFDALVRLPLTVGMVNVLIWLENRHRAAAPGQLRPTVALSCMLLAVIATLAPAWSGRIAPKGSFEAVPTYWQEAATWLNENAQGTRTIVLPASSFARHTWGWTRDEPLQPLANVPWVVRDAVPLVPPEAIRSLDGIITRPNEAALARIGVGVVVVRHDLTPNLQSHELAQRFQDAGYPKHQFGQVDIFELDRTHSMSVTSAPAAKVAGSGESLALLDELHGEHAYELQQSPEHAEIVTDTPALSVRNYGTIYRANSAPLATLAEGSDIKNAVPNYPTTAQPIALEERGGHVAVSSSASDASAFGGADPARSPTAAIDHHPSTAWFPAPGRQTGQWLELRPTGGAANPEVTFTVTGSPVVVTVSAGHTAINRTAYPHRPITVTLPEAHTDSIRLTLGASALPAGIAEAHVRGHDIDRVMSVPASTEVQHFLFQRLWPDTGVIRREFTVPENSAWTIDAATCHEDAATPGPVPTDLTLDGSPITCGATVHLNAGTHTIESTSAWLTLTRPGYRLPPAPRRIGTTVPAAPEAQILHTGRAFNPGLRASINGVQLQPRQVDAAMQGFIVPPGVSGPVTLSFAGDPAYRRSLLAGGLLAVSTLALAAATLRRRGTHAQHTLELPEQAPFLLGLAAMTLVGGGPALAGIALAWLIIRFTLIPRAAVAGAGVGIAGMWLAHAPWPTESYAGDQWFSAVACCVSLGAVVLPRGVDKLRRKRAAGRSTNS